jgi:hypothetical protein
MFISNDPAVLNEGIDFGKVSTNEIDNSLEIIDYDTFGLGYAMLSKDRYNYINNKLSYYDFRHHLIWSKNLDPITTHIVELEGSDQNLLLLITDHNTYWNFTSVGVYISNVTSNATIYDLDGRIVSTFPIDITRMSNETGLDYQWRRSRIVYSLLSENEVYLVEFVEGQLLNDTYDVNIILYSYDLLTGQLKWGENLTRDIYPILEPVQSIPSIESIPLLNIYEYKFIDSSELLLTIGSIYNNINLKQFSIKLDNFKDLEEITKIENNFVCVDDCWDDIILSFDEVIGVSNSIDGNEITTTLKSSFGSELEMITFYRYSSYYNRPYSGIDFYHFTSLTGNEMMVNGLIPLESEKFNSFIGYLTSDNKLSLTLFDMNKTNVDKMIKIDEIRILTSEMDQYPTRYSMVIWSLNKLKVVDFVNPYYINILPGLALIILIANVSYDRYKIWKDPKSENY